LNSNAVGALGLDGKVALVTGATRGLGRAIAHKLAASGCHVLLNYAHSAAAAEQALSGFDGLAGSAELVRGDVATAEGTRDVLDMIEGRHGRLDVLVHNAAVFAPMSPLKPDTVAFGAAFAPMSPLKPDTVAFGAAHALALGPLLHGAGPVSRLMPAGGRIVAISSNGAGEVIPGYVATGVAKAAMESLVRYLAVELAPYGIAVNAVATALLDKGEATGPKALMDLLASRTPGGRLTLPEDVADAVALLCTAEASWIQGQVVMVDGGLGLRS
jgi:enoyl-[acyl-carrier protein] reductase III